MTTKKALLCLKGMKWHIEQGNPIWPGKDLTLALDMAIEALKKQIPMQVKITASTKRCGRCNKQLSDIRNSHPQKIYCHKCGQKIQWL